MRHREIRGAVPLVEHAEEERLEALSDVDVHVEALGVALARP